MNAYSCTSRAILLALFECICLASPAETLQLISRLDPGQPPPAGGSGDSWVPVLSADGRFVLFSSGANNLLLTTNNTPMPAVFPANLNVFLRDRTNQTTALVSVNLSGVAGGNGDSLPVGLSADARFALFESSASNLVPGDTNSAADIFVRDVQNNVTVLASINTNGVAGNGVSRSPAMTPDGRFVAFVSAANDLTPNDNNGIPDVFVRDLQTGTTTLVSVGARARSNPGYAGNSSEAPEITPDGRYVAFYSTATNLVPGVPVNGDIYIRDLVAGTTVWASAGARAAALGALKTTNVVCYNSAISADGQTVVYEASPASGSFTPGILLRYNVGSGTTDVVYTNAAVSVAAYEDIHNLDMTPDGRFVAFVANTNGTSGATTCICVWDAQTGAITLASGDANNQVATNSISDSPSIDPSGRFVTYLSSATNLVTNNVPGEFHIYVRDLQASVTVLIDSDTNGVGSPISAATVPRLSANATLVAFEAPDGSLVPNDRNRDFDVFVRDLAAGTSELSSAHHPSLATRTPNGINSLAPSSLSSDGRFVVFASEADNLVANDTNNSRDIFVRDLATGTLTLVSANTNGVAGDAISSEPAISPDGRYVVFSSLADDLVAGDTNPVQDIFMRDLQTGTTTLVSVNSAATGSGNKASGAPAVGLNGRFVLFRSQASNLAPGSFSGENIFLRDLVTQTTLALTTLGSGPAVLTPDGRWIAYVIGSVPLSLGVWDTEAAARVYTNMLGVVSVSGLAIVATGPRLAYAAPNGLFVVQVPTGSKTTVETNSAGSSVLKDLRFDAAGRFLAYTRGAGVGPTNQVYLYDYDTQSRTLLSASLAGSAPANGSSDSPDISANGRFVAYRSVASNLVAGDTNGVPDIYLYDLQTAQNTLLSASVSGSVTPNNRSLTPVFSGDGSTLLFASWASDLLSGDFNHNSDIFGTTLLSAVILPNADPAQGPWLTWPWELGKNYRVEYLDSLGGACWQPLSGTITNLGIKAWLQDPSPPAGQRFYRIVSF